MKHIALVLLLTATALFAEEYEWEAVIYPKTQLFASQLVTTATMDRNDEDIATWDGNVVGDVFGVIGATVYGLEEGQKVRLEIAANDVIAASSWEGSIPSTEDAWMIFPTLDLKYGELLSAKATRPLTVKMTLFVDGERIGEIAETATLRGINDCLFGVQEEGEEDGEDGEFSDYTWLFAGYVNEGHPWVDNVLRDALSLGIVEQFDGYQSEDAEVVITQIYAIWRTMQEMGLKYSDVSATSAEKEGVYSQHVRLFDDALAARQANCVDGSVMLASILRKIGLHPYLILVPGHMFIAVDLDAEGENTIGIETTLMGATDLPSLKASGAHVGDALKEQQDEESMATFLAAAETGTEELKKHLEALEDEDQPNYQSISIQAAREYGILPIGFK